MAFVNSLQHALTMNLEAVGVTVGKDDSCDVVIKDDSIFQDIFFRGSLAIGEDFVNGKWWSRDLTCVLARAMRAQVPLGTLNLPYRFLQLAHTLTNPEDASKAQKIADHYNTDNRLYQKQLGSTMAYTCAYFGRGAATLDDAQHDKLDLVCEKIHLQPGQRVLDIGCGFGSFARHAAKEFGAKVTGITISESQIELGKELCAGLDVELLFMNYPRSARSLRTRVVRCHRFHRHVRARRPQELCAVHANRTEAFEAERSFPSSYH